MTRRDWRAWHELYEDEGSPLHRRLMLVQCHIRDAHAAPTGPLRIISMCAGQGRDLIGALEDHPRRQDTVTRLVELDERNVDFARASARAAGLDSIDVVAGDASRIDAYEGVVPADRRI